MSDAEPLELACAVCLYVRLAPDASESAYLDTKTIIVKSGISVCSRHIPCVGDTNMVLHHAVLAGVRMESDGRLDNLTAYHAWRAEQDPGWGP